MTKDTFFFNMKGMNSIDIGHYTLYKKPCILVDNNTDQEIRFKNMEDAINNAVLDDVPLSKVIKESDNSLFTIVLDDTGLTIVG